MWLLIKKKSRKDYFNTGFYIEEVYFLAGMKIYIGYYSASFRWRKAVHRNGGTFCAQYSGLFLFYFYFFCCPPKKKPVQHYIHTCTSAMACIIWKH